jgi:hypothetical protein
LQPGGHRFDPGQLHQKNREGSEPMKKQSRGLSTRAEITIHKVPVVGVVGFIFVVGIIAIALLGLPVTKWFLLASLLAGIAVAGTIRLAHKLRPRTEEEEIQLNVGRQTRQP